VEVGSSGERGGGGGDSGDDAFLRGEDIFRIARRTGAIIQ
jgi:hypothetical protein